MFQNTSNLLIFAAVFLFDKAVFSADAADDWGYSDENGPDSWPGVCNTGVRQSPINIVTSAAVEAGPSYIKFSGYNSAIATNATNNGHTILVQSGRLYILNMGFNDVCTVDLETNEVPIYLRSIDLPSIYVLADVHFHWGSEHRINGVQDALEIHFVHYAWQYQNSTYAAQFENGIAVVAVLFEVCEQDNVDLDQLITAVKNISSASSQLTTKTKLIPSRLLPKDHSSYYTYRGSLTTPNCQEAAIWLVMSNKMPISASQLEVFRHVQSSANHTLFHNNRPIQKLGPRLVYYHHEYYSG